MKSVSSVLQYRGDGARAEHGDAGVCLGPRRACLAALMESSRVTSFG